MKIIEKYIILEFLKVFAICLSGFVMMLLLIDITDKIKYYFHYNPPGGLMLKYFLVKLPGYLFFGIPLGILLAGMLALLTLARHYELIAMQANGVDALHIAKPVLAAGLVASFIMFLADETVIPWSNRYSEYIQNVEIAGKSDTTYFKKDQIWIRTRDGIIHVENFRKSDQSLEKITIIHWSPYYEFSERLYADKAKWWQNHWMLYGVNRTVRTAKDKIIVETLPSLEWKFSKTPEDFQRVEVATREMNISQLSDYIDKLEEEGQSPQRYLVDWHAKIAFPIVCLIMSALSVPFAITATPRGGGIGIGLGISLVIAFSYWIAHTMFISLGHAGYIPPPAAAWGANIIFGLAAGVMLLQAGT
mgnify:CR=1 FL=1